jgi:hypothetical protein
MLEVGAEFDEVGWLAQRRARADLDRHGSVVGQLGVLEARFALAGGRIRDVVLAGDFIANSPAIARLEDALRGCPAEPAAIEAMVEGVFAAPGNFILGIPVRNVADAIARGLRR